MSRNKGTFNFAANFEVLAAAPLDARMVVGTYADLTTPATWEDGSSLVWLYDGAIVAVSNDGDVSKNGLYFLKDAANYTSTSSWEKLGSASGSTLNDVQNVGSGAGVFSGITGTSVLLRSIVGSGNTSVSTSGDTIVINSIDSTALQNGILRFDTDQQTFLPYTGITTVPEDIIFYTGVTCPCPTGNTRMAVNARLTVTELRLSTGRTDIGSVPHLPGDLYWDDDDSTITLHQTQQVKQQVGQELYIRVKNDTAGLIPNGTVVYISGSDAGRPTILAARASEIDTAIIDEVVGMVTEDIPAGQIGFVTTAGIVRDLNTSGYTAGDVVYLSTTVAGGLTTTRPIYPDYVVEIGVVTKVDPTDGHILIKVSNLSQIRNIRGVETVNPPYTATTRSDVISSIGSGIIYLPASPLTGQQITVLDQDGDASTWNITVDGNGKNINGDTQATINTDYGSLTLVYNGTRWYATTVTP